MAGSTRRDAKECQLICGLFAAAKADRRGCTVGDADRYTLTADAVVAEFAKIDGGLRHYAPV